ncbi:hypothetical protein [Taibaiella sp. KBW10]|uniref:hypothetical protein n=1 Tax=Taibaiella sp. KBW10 TaxID=2153357 RepID=UPI000F5A61F3|nr:hypothetical protein [Taibaiella sp. KBW10]
MNLARMNDFCPLSLIWRRYQTADMEDDEKSCSVMEFGDLPAGVSHFVISSKSHLPTIEVIKSLNQTCIL